MLDVRSQTSEGSLAKVASLDLEKALHSRVVSVTNPFVAVSQRSRKSRKGKQHPVHASSLEHIAQALATASGDAILPTLTNAQLLTVIAHIFKKEHDRVTAIVR